MDLLLVALPLLSYVHGNQVNVARGKNASTTTGVYGNWSPSGAVDGNNTELKNPSSCFHAASSPADWTVDLGQEYQLYNIIVYLRTEFYDRTANSSIYLDNNSSKVCYTFPSTISDNPTRLTCNGTARFVTIRNPGTRGIHYDSLNICEVEIYACSNRSHGADCNEVCQCSMCDRWTGVCSSDCDAGRHGDYCDIVCNGMYGVNCYKSCDERKCSTESLTCDVVYGACEAGCLPGWNGTDCTKDCDERHYGPNCAGECNERHCEGDSSCNSTTGRCDGGCQSGWAGTDCKEHQSPEETPDTASAVVGLSTALVLIIIVAVVIISILCWKMRRKTDGKGMSPNLATIKVNAGWSNQTPLADVYTQARSPDGNGHTASESSVVETRLTYDTLQKSGDNLYTDLKPKTFYENI